MEDRELRTSNRMKTKCFKVDWLIPVLGIAVVAGCLVAATTCRELERRARAEEAFIPALDRLSYDHTLSLVLKTLHEGEVDKAAQRLDLLLCWDILRADAELASADPRTRAWAQEFFGRIARARPKNAERPAAGSAWEHNEAQAGAQRILELALAGAHDTRTR